MASTQEDVLAEDLSDLNLKEIHTKEHQGPSRGKKPAAKRGPRPPDTPPVQLSKALSYILRHGAAKEGLPLRADGYVLLDQVLGRPRVSKISMSGGQEGKGDKPAENAPSKDDVLSIVKADSKGRFETKEDEEHRIWIRAVQGHSIKDVTALDHVDLTLDNLHILESKDAAPLPRGTLPDGIEILHGTTRDAWGKIETSGGLSRMKRNHIHLAKGRPGAAGVISGESMKYVSDVHLRISRHAELFPPHHSHRLDQGFARWYCFSSGVQRSCADKGERRHWGAPSDIYPKCRRKQEQQRNMAAIGTVRVSSSVSRVHRQKLLT